jgi:YD repeat-containing protein
MRKLVFILIVAAAFTSCSKDKNDSNWIFPVETKDRYKTVSFPARTTTYTYDQYGRQVLEGDDDGSKTESSYAKGKVYRTYYTTSGIMKRTVTISLNNDGLRQSESYSDNPASYTHYEYNSDKKLAKVISKNDADIVESVYFYSNGNMDSTQYFKNGVRYLTNKYDYYLDQPAIQVPGNVGISYYKSDRIYMMKSLTHVPVNGGIVYEEYTYTYDAKGRLETLTQNSTTGSVGMAADGWFDWLH